MDYWNYDENARERDFDLDNIIDSLGNIDDMYSFTLVTKLYHLHLSESDLDKVLERDDIREKLAIGLLEESKENFYAGFREVLRYFTPRQFISLYDARTLKSFFSGNLKNHEYKFFVCLLEKDFNGIINYVLSDDEMFNELFKINDNFYSMFSSISYDLFRNVILKMGDDISSYPSDFIGIIDENYQKRILSENISDDMIIYLVPRFKDNVISEFLCNNPKGRYLFNKFNIKNFVERGIKFDDEIVKTKEFFDSLKCDNFVDFRTIINEAEKNNNLDIIMRRLNNYYNEIINSYDSNTGLFKEYLILVNNPELKVSIKDVSFIVDKGLVMELHNYYDWDESGNRVISNRERLISYLKEVTSRKLSDVIVDALFEDNIYNVWLNIGEMLRYNSKLSDDKKVLEKKREDFYNMILHLDELPSDEKISLFHKLSDKRVNFMFYDDLRKIKDLSYDLIKEELFSVEDKHNDVNLNSELSNKYGIKVYDLRDKEYTMLIRGEGRHRDKSGNRRNCYSVIGSDNSSVYGDADGYLMYYGYNSFDNDKVIHILEQDSFSGDYGKKLPTKYVNRIMTSSELIRNSSWYSEIDLVNVKDEDGMYIAKRPDFVVYYDNGTNDILRSIDEAKKLNIPLVIINEKILEQDKRMDIPFDKEKDYYIQHNDIILNEMRTGKAR